MFSLIGVSSDGAGEKSSAVREREKEGKVNRGGGRMREEWRVMRGVGWRRGCIRRRGVSRGVSYVQRS